MRSAGMCARARVVATPPSGHHRPALRVALGLAVPGVALLSMGRPDLIIYAVFGAVTGMYGRTDPRRRRAIHQGQAAAVLITGVGIGVAVAALRTPPAVLVAIAVVFATAVSVLADHFALKPETPFFGLFALGAVATLPVGRVAPPTAVTVCAATALLCVLLGAADAHDRVSTVEPLGSTRPGVLLHAGRYALAVGSVGTAGLLLGIDHANWAMAAAAGPLAASDARGRVQRGMHRLTGTFVGLGVAAALLAAHPDAHVLAVCVMVLLFPTELFMAHHHAVALGFFTPLIMLMTDLAAPAPPHTLLLARGVDTMIGVAAAVATALILHGRRISPPNGSDVERIRRSVAPEP